MSKPSKVLIKGGVLEGRNPSNITTPLLEHRSHCEGVTEDMSLRGAERRSKLKDKIASPSARNDGETEGEGDKGGEVR